MSAEEEIHHGAMRVLCELGSYKRMLMLQGNQGSSKQKFRLTTLLYSAADVNYSSTRKLINRHRFGGKKTVVRSTSFIWYFSVALNDLVETVYSTNRLIFYVLIYLFVKSFINRRSLASLLAFTLFEGPEIEATTTFETLLLQVLQTDTALAKFGQICPFNITSNSLRNGLFFKGRQ